MALTPGFIRGDVSDAELPPSVLTDWLTAKGVSDFPALGSRNDGWPGMCHAERREASSCEKFYRSPLVSGAGWELIPRPLLLRREGREVMG